MKGFKDKKGKFHPTGERSGLKKKDMSYKKTLSNSSGVEHEMRDKKTINKFDEVRKLEKNIQLENERIDLIVDHLENLLENDKDDDLFYEQLDIERLQEVQEKLEEIEKMIQPVLDKEDY